MSVTPSALFDLAVARHREPWNWTLHASAAGLFCLALLAHSFLLLAASMILGGVGFLRLDLETPPDNLWFRIVASAVTWERNWAAAPWNRGKWSRFLLTCSLTGVAVWALVIRELAVLGLLVCVAALIRVAWENRQNGIKP